jgi:hypothetical protein
MNDKDHVRNKPQPQDTTQDSAYKPKPSDLGNGAASNVAEAILKRKQQLDDI